MDTTEKPKRKWWRKKRWRAALLLWLAVGYPASLGPASYAYARGWLARETAYAPFWPLAHVYENTGLKAYDHWWLALGNQHQRAAWRRASAEPSSD